MKIARDDPNTILKSSEPEHQSGNSDNENQSPIPPKKSPFSKVIAHLRRHFTSLSLRTSELMPKHKRGKGKQKDGPRKEDSGLHMEAAADSERKEESLAERYPRAFQQRSEGGNYVLYLEHPTDPSKGRRIVDPFEF
jgi:hypothetical protein